MEEKQKKADEAAYKPDMTNYDFVWGSDQDEYVKDKTSADASPEQTTVQKEE
ncbi:hypothetical protein FHS16_003121 [Paenibacillus endophyticus]|uniref:Uncharacterized protein n=1 Tax=Paenibacillus endophyticus TaxID=1294268 RepID=A0A7W5C8H2_9BACL|nr:hypothetical protein [Paenibacillus endophyticus]MBB3153062.1 hypothetical protein [Paenibacillus endophyticus]